MNYDHTKAQEHTSRYVASLLLWDCEIKQQVGGPMQCFADMLRVIIVEANVEESRKRAL